MILRLLHATITYLRGLLKKLQQKTRSLSLRYAVGFIIANS